MKAILLATVAAISIQPFVFFLLSLLPLMVQGADIRPKDSIGLPLLSALFAAPFVVLIGIPSLLLLRHFNRLSWLSLGAVGFIAAAIPFAFYGWSEHPSSFSSGNWYGTSVDFVIDGQKTFHGWLSYVQGVLVLGLHGLTGALAFFFVWRRRLGPNNSFKPKPLRGSA